MSKRASITAVYRMNEREFLQVTVALPTPYPDALNEAKTTVVAMMRDMFAEITRITVVVDEP